MAGQRTKQCPPDLFHALSVRMEKYSDRAQAIAEKMEARSMDGVSVQFWASASKGLMAMDQFLAMAEAEVPREPDELDKFMGEE